MSLKKQLARYKKHLSHSTAAETIEKPSISEPEHSQTLDKSLQSAASGLEAQIKFFDEQVLLEKKTSFPLTTLHGAYRFEEIYDAVGLWKSDLKDHPLSANQLQAEDLLFFDTETTGLGSGAGHMIFLLGTGKIVQDQFEVTQYFLPGPGHEAAFYYYFLSDNKDLSNLVTFNGKAFDWPRVKTRVQFVRDRVPKLPEYGHFDLLHASRRMWKDQLESVRLSIIEEELLGLKRELDVPGHMAPFLYFQFLKSPKASLVKGVFEHNAEDIKGLVTLYIHLSRLLHQKNETASLEEQFQCCRWLFKLGFLTEARVWLEKLSGQAETASSTNQAKILHLLAQTCKKQQLFNEANDYFVQLIDRELTKDPFVCIEAAMHYEHRANDYEKAIFYTEKALNWLNEEPIDHSDHYQSDYEAFRHRLVRLQTKNSPK